MEITPIDADQRVRHAKSLFQRTLSQWASDVLLLQSRGERAPTWGSGRPSTHQHVVVETPRRKAA